jgi:predicted lipoprotein with Yx(FWY)xxD motif
MMSGPLYRDGGRRLPRAAVLVIAALAGSGVAVIAGMASASSFTLRVAKNVHVTNQTNAVKMFAAKAVNTHEAVAVGPSGYAVYTFQGETTHHIICKKTSSAATNCWGFWPPVTVGSANGISKQAGIKGTLGTFRNHRQLQLTLNGQPLYYFTPDIQSGKKSQATGDELKTFGSIWHVVTASGSVSGAAANTQPATTTSSPGYTTTGTTTTSTQPAMTTTGTTTTTTTSGYVWG